MGAWALAIDVGTAGTVAATLADGHAELISFDGDSRLPWRGRYPAHDTQAIGEALRRAVEEAVRTRGGERPTQVSIACPARAAEAQLAELREAVSAARIGDVSFVPAPVAAAVSFGLERVVVGRFVAVYDLGAGSFEVSVLRRTEKGFEAVSAAGGTDVGGQEFDERLCRFLGYRPDPANQELEREVRLAKERLSTVTESVVEIPAAIEREIVISRDDFEDLIRPDIEATVLELERVIGGAGLSASELSAIYLVGGSTRIPLVASQIHQQFGLTPVAATDPTGAIAIGAALLAGRAPTSAATVIAPAATGAAEDGPGPPNVLDDDVQFTVYRPHSVQPSRWYALLAFAHKSEPFLDEALGRVDPTEEVRRLAAARLGEQTSRYVTVSDDASQALPQGSMLTFVPEADGVEFNPPKRSFRWLESVHQEEFRMRAEPRLDGNRVRGTLSVYFGSILIAEVSLSFRVNGKGESPALTPERAHPYRKIFVSYSHHDEAVVEQVETFVSTVGDEFLRDARDLRSGEVWGPRLAEMIDEADIFQLFWSRNSMVSEFVRQEWTYALDLHRDYFVRPVFWEQPMPESKQENLPPQELRRLHFRYLPGVLGGSGSPGAARPEAVSHPPDQAVGTGEFDALAPAGDVPDSAPREQIAPGATRSDTPEPAPARAGSGGSFLGAIMNNPAVATVLLVIVIGVPAALVAIGGSGTGSTRSYSTQATTLTQPATTASSSASPRGFPPGAVAACGGTLFVGPSTSCAFALNVQQAYLQTAGGDRVVSAFSPAAGRTYRLLCASSSPTTCTSPDHETVYFY